MPIKLWTCVLTAPSQLCSHNYTCYYKQVARSAITPPPAGHSSKPTRCRALSWPMSTFADQTPGTLYM